MFASKTVYALTAGTLIAASLPALADHGRWDRGYDHRYERAPRVVEYRRPFPVMERRVERRVVERRVYVDRPVYVERPAPVYHRAYEPAPAYYPPVYEPAPAHGVNVLGTAAGAIVGAAIGSQIGYGHNRAATTAVGAVIGGAIG
ncbi:MAG: glycine zipper 2TM domain-containing protein, partial [Burkholderiales bacterium]